MIYLLLGKDDFSKKDFLNELKAKLQAQNLEYFYDWQEQAVLWGLKNSGLFEKKKIFVVFNQLGKFDFEAFLAQTKGATNDLVFVEDALDKRKTETKKILASKDLQVQEFNIPIGADFRKWIQNFAKKIELKLSGKALDLFLQRIGAENEQNEQLYDLWQASFELKKLKTFAGSKEVAAEDVEQLVSENLDENVFKITNAIADRNKKEAMKTLADFMDRIPGTDEKSKIISLSGILAEQFRGILVIQSLLSDRIADAEIMKLTGYSPGRLFVYKKLAKNFTAQKVLDALRKMELLDEEIKTSQGPAGLQFLMIINSVIA